MARRFRKLRLMLEVARSGSISDAANLFGLSQPAASRAIQSLESSFETALFHRDHGGVRPTRAGELIEFRMKRAVGLLEHAERVCGCAAGAIALRSAGHELRAIEGVSNAGTLGGAARAIGISQPALTQSLRGFERRCDTQLFFRAMSGMRATPQGERIVRLVKLALREIEYGFDEIGHEAGRSGGRFTIGALPLARSEIVPAAIEIVLGRYPAAKIRVHDGSYSGMLQMLRNGDIDVIIGTLRDHPPAEELTTTFLFEDDMVVVSRRGHPLQGRADVGFAEALSCGWVLPFEGVPLRTQFESFLDEQGLERPRHAIESDSIAVLRMLLMNSDRLAVVSRHQVPLDLRLGLLATLPLKIARMDRCVGLTYRADYRPTPLGTAFDEAFVTVTEQI